MAHRNYEIDSPLFVSIDFVFKDAWLVGIVPFN